MTNEQKTIFISYRRQASHYLSVLLFKELTNRGYDVFLDIEKIDSGDFNRIILGQIAARAHFVLLLTTGTVERCVNEGDWLRKEIEHALDTGRNIVPVMFDDFDPAKAQPYLTGKLEPLLNTYNALRIYRDYMDAGLDKLVERFLKAPAYVDEQSVSPMEAQAAALKIQEAKAAPTPTAQTLTAEEHFRRGYAHYSQNQPSAAIEAFTEAVRLNPRYPEPYIYRGRAYEMLNQSAKALADFRQLMEINPESAYAHLAQGFIAQNQRQFEAALRHFESALTLDPQNVIAYNNRGNVQAELKAYAAAIADYDAAIRLKPDYAMAYNNRGLAHAALGDTEKAIADFETALRLYPDLALAYHNRGNTRYKQGDYVGAMADYNEALRLNPNNADIYNNRGNARYDQNDEGGALDDYNAAVRFNPQFDYAYFNRGRLYYQRKDYAQALADFSAAIQHNPHYADSYRNRGLVYQKQGQKVLAAADFQRYLDLGGADKTLVQSWIDQIVGRRDVRWLYGVGALLIGAVACGAGNVLFLGGFLSILAWMSTVSMGVMAGLLLYAYLAAIQMEIS